MEPLEAIGTMAKIIGIFFGIIALLIAPFAITTILVYNFTGSGIAGVIAGIFIEVIAIVAALIFVDML